MARTAAKLALGNREGVAINFTGIRYRAVDRIAQQRERAAEMSLNILRRHRSVCKIIKRRTRRRVAHGEQSLCIVVAKELSRRIVGVNHGAQLILTVVAIHKVLAVGADQLLNIVVSISHHREA